MLFCKDNSQAVLATVSRACERDVHRAMCCARCNYNNNYNNNEEFDPLLHSDTYRCSALLPCR